MTNIKELLEKLNEWKKKNDTIDIYKEYEMTLSEWDKKYTHRNHQILAGKAHKLLSTLVDMGTYTQEEYDDAMRCFLVAIDGRKFLLDIKKAFDDFNLQELRAKYTLG